MTRTTPLEFAERYGARPAGPAPSAPEATPDRAPPDDRLRSDEFWPWLALGLVGLLLAEGFLANRTAA